MSNLNDLVKNMEGAALLLIGDIMLDTFVYGGVSRISPEAPIPVLSVSREDKMLGGAGNVLSNLCALGAKTQFISVIGADFAGQEISQKIADLQISEGGVVITSDRPTILKTRYLSQNQQLLRVDNENPEPIDQNIQGRIFDHAVRMIETAQAMILSDYGKGLLTPELVKRLIKLARKNKVPVIIDPKGVDFSVYKGASIITPNKKELFEATGGMPVSNDAQVEAAAQSLIKKNGIETIIATRSEDGMSVVSKKGEALHLKTRALEVFDVSGAGDTVVAVIAAASAAGGTLDEVAALANIAGGLAVSKVGTAIVRGKEIAEALIAGGADIDTPARIRVAQVMEQDTAIEKIRKWQAQGLKIGFTNGCFDILHYGHVNYLNQARDRCDRLVVGLNHDLSVKILKGETRPLNDQMARATVLGALGSVDLVVFFGAEEQEADNTPCALVEALKPDILMKGGDYTIDQLPEGKIALSYGGQVDIMPLYEGYSTTDIIEKSKKGSA